MAKERSANRVQSYASKPEEAWMTTTDLGFQAVVQAEVDSRASLTFPGKSSKASLKGVLPKVRELLVKWGPESVLWELGSGKWRVEDI